MKKKYLLLTAIGEDRPGIVERITRRIVNYAGNIEESRTARLGGEFAAFFLVSIPFQIVHLCRIVFRIFAKIP